MREVWGIAPGRLLSRKRKAQTPGGENPIEWANLGGLLISNIGGVSSPSSKTAQYAIWRQGGLMDVVFCNIFTSARSVLRALCFH